MTTFKQEICRNLTFLLRLRQILIINARIKDLKIGNKDTFQRNPLLRNFSCRKVCILNYYLYICTVSSHQASQRCSNAWGFFVYIRSLSKYANGKITAQRKYHGERLETQDNIVVARTCLEGKSFLSSLFP